jgi:hypothetical protein
MIMSNGEVNDFVSRLVARLGDRLESITFYSHPFTNGGVVIVPKDDVEFIPDLIAEIYACGPPAITLNCLRRSELFQLSDIGIFGWPNPLEERPHLAYWLKNKGEVLFGRDVRDEIKLPGDRSSFLDIHLQRVKHCIRNWCFDQLLFKNHKRLVTEIERQTKYLMATALLEENEWDVLPEAIPARFDQMFKNERANQIWADINALNRGTDEMGEATDRQSALEALWQFEQFMAQVGECKR